ncbi:MAG: hypothetical protein M1823_005061 [Watsoniomyces obsoletus]|nr:MAG: hypothetical protein M1823_005061 [Watsoniomyces obsoletus]
MSTTNDIPDRHATTLARVRENQRRCRARKRDYIAHLEQRLHDQEKSTGVLRRTERENAYRRLEQENKKLRELLEVVGLQRPWVDTFLNSDARSAFRLMGREDAVEDDPSPMASNQNDQVGRVGQVGSPLEALTVSRMLTTSTSSSPKLPETSSHEDPLAFLNGVDLDLTSFDPTMPSHLTSSLVPTTKISSSSLRVPAHCTRPASKCALCPPGCSCPGLDEMTCSSEDSSDGGQTPCSEAYQLLLQHTNKEVDLLEVGMRLWKGFRCNPETDECSVLNTVLFDSLDRLNR